MDILQNIDFSTVVVLALGCGLLLAIVMILFFGIQIIGTILGVFGQLLGLFTGIVSGGPETWCGCIVLFFGCGVCSVFIFAVINLIQTCDTNPVNFCRFLGY